MNKIFKRIVSLLLAIMMFLPIVEAANITAFAANDSVTLYQYQSVGNGKAGPMYSGSVTLKVTKEKDNIQYGIISFINSKCLLFPGGDAYNNGTRGGYDVFGKSEIYFAMKKNSNEIRFSASGNKKGLENYMYIAKIHYGNSYLLYDFWKSVAIENWVD